MIGRSVQTQKSKPRIFSFEFFPPKTPEGVERLAGTQRQLAQLGPEFFSVTYGAGGTTRDRTLETVLAIQRDGQAAAPHISCIGSSRESLREVLNQYRAHGIRHIVALRGDLPSGMMSAGEFRYASDLVAFIRQETGDHFFVEVAAYPEVHPQARNAQEALRHFKTKVDAGADSAISASYQRATTFCRRSRLVWQ